MKYSSCPDWTMKMWCVTTSHGYRVQQLSLLLHWAVLSHLVHPVTTVRWILTRSGYHTKIFSFISMGNLIYHIYLDNVCLRKWNGTVHSDTLFQTVQLHIFCKLVIVAEKNSCWYACNTWWLQCYPLIALASVMVYVLKLAKLLGCTLLGSYF